MKYDLIVIGMGISGITAAIYAKNSGLNVLMIEKSMPGGLLNKINTINNYPGVGVISGPDLASKLFDTVNELNIPYKILTVTNIKIENDKKVVETSNENFICDAVIIATGRKSKTLNLANEKELLGRGISTCALCDGSLYKNKIIAIVGGGNSAVEEAIYLSNIVNKIYMIHRRDEFTAEKSLVKELEQKDNIEYLWNSQVTSLIKEEDKLKGIVINGEKRLDVEGLFTYIGYEPSISFLNSLNITDEYGYILVSDKYETKVSGIYAVGDAIRKDVYQLVTAASDGAIAAINAFKTIDKQNTIDKD